MPPMIPPTKTPSGGASPPESTRRKSARQHGAGAGDAPAARPAPPPAPAAYAAAGEALGKDMARRLGENTRRVFQEVLGQLRSEIPDPGSGPAAAPEPAAGALAARSASTPDPIHAAPPARPLPAAADPARTRAAIERIRRQFQDAAEEWKRLQTAVDEIRREFARRAADDILGVRASRRAPPAQPAGGATAAPGALRSGAAPAGAPTSREAGPRGDSPAAAAPARSDDAPAAPGRSLESKLDELIALVRDQMAEGARTSPSEGGVPSNFTQQVAREVVNRLRESLPMASAPVPESERKAGEAASHRERISLDDVAGMIDQITGGKR